MSRQPIVTRAAIVAAVALTVAILGRFGVVVPPDTATHIVELLAVAAPFALAYWARRHTTPLTDPRDANGRPLVPVETASDLHGGVETPAQADTPSAASSGGDTA